MANVWTHGTWTVKPGKEDEFAAEWFELARRSASDSMSVRPTLLRDRDQQNVFVSFGPWPDDAAVERFRSSDAFRDAQTRMRDLLEAFEPHTLDEVGQG